MGWGGVGSIVRVKHHVDCRRFACRDFPIGGSYHSSSKTSWCFTRYVSFGNRYLSYINRYLSYIGRGGVVSGHRPFTYQSLSFTYREGWGSIRPPARRVFLQTSSIGRYWSALVGTGGYWVVLVGTGGCWWVLVDTGGYWWVLVGTGGYWWEGMF